MSKNTLEILSNKLAKTIIELMKQDDYCEIIFNYNSCTNLFSGKLEEEYTYKIDSPSIRGYSGYDGCTYSNIESADLGVRLTKCLDEVFKEINK